MAKKDIAEDLFINNSNIPEEISIDEFLHQNGLEYAHYVLTDRALISDDGIKPVNRRLLYAMYNMGLKPGGKKTKANRIVGETIGKFHPHGNLSVSAALARMGQTFSLRVPLLDVQGSVGFVTGDSPAADRYWEATLNKAAWELLKEIGNKAAVMVPTEDGEGVEPYKLPITWPIGIINGSQGIAVGYASSMPSHNPNEVMDACIAYLKGKVNNTKQLMKYIKGPDFPTGGELIGVDGVEEYFETGKGSFTVRGKYKINELPRGRYSIEFYELPYQVSAEQVKEAINKGQSNEKKPRFKEISEVKDLTDNKSGLKLVIYVKSGSNIHSVLEELWKFTPCQSKFSVNATILLEDKPNPETSMLQMIEQFIQFRTSTFIKKSNYELRKLQKEFHRLSGILKVLVDIDKAIEIIRNAESSEIAQEQLIKHFGIDEEQATSILGMRLRSLTLSDKNELYSKCDSIEESLKHLSSILSSEDLIKKEIIKELQETKKIIGDERKTSITGVTNEDLALAAKEAQRQEKLLLKDVTCDVSVLADNSVVMTLGEEISQLKLPIKYSIQTTSQGTFYVFSKDGDCIEAQVNSLQPNTPVSPTLFGLKDNKFAGITNNVLETLFVTNFGNGNIARNNIKSGKLTTLLPMEEIVFLQPISDDEYNSKEIVLITEDGTISKTAVKNIRKSGFGSGTVIIMKDAMVKDGTLTTPNLDEILVTVSNNEVKLTLESDCPSKNRGGKGYNLHKLKAGDKIKSIQTLTIDGKATNEKGELLELPAVSPRASAGKFFDSTHIFVN